MGLTEDWKKAKKRFEVVTSKRKPSEKYLGACHNGHGIETSLTKADAAKTASELREALDDFEKEGAAYTTVLRAAAADPECVPPEDKPTYLSNTASLEKALTKLMAAGEEMAASLEGTDKEAQVDTDPKIVLGQLMGINKELIELDVWITKKSSTLKMNLAKQKVAFAEQKTPKENMVRGFTMVRDAELKAREAVEAKTQSLVALERRVSVIPTELHDHSEVALPRKQFVETAARVKNDLSSVEEAQEEYIDYLNDCIGQLA